MINIFKKIKGHFKLWLRTFLLTKEEEINLRLLSICIIKYGINNKLKISYEDFRSLSAILQMDRIDDDEYIYLSIHKIGKAKKIKKEVPVKLSKDLFVGLY